VTSNPAINRSPTMDITVAMTIGGNWCHTPLTTAALKAA
jgi:hypothetical protein